MNHFYVYVFWDTEFNCPIYVGKGVGDRWKVHLKKSPNVFLRKRISEIKHKYGKVKVKTKRFLSEEEAFGFEKKLIGKYGRIKLGTGTLLNLTDGGEGGALRGTVKKRMIESLKKFWVSEEGKAAKEIRRKKTLSLWENLEYRNNYIKKICSKKKEK